MAGFDSTMGTRAARRRLGATAVAVALALGAAPLTARAGDAVSVTYDATPVPPSTPALVVGDPAPCGHGSWLAGSVEVCAGEVVYRDYVYDAHGASQYPAPHPAFRYDPVSFPAGFAYGAYPPAGGQTFNRPDHEANLGDIVAVRVRRAGNGGGLDLSMELNTLTDPASTRAIVLADRTLGGPSRTVNGLVANPLNRTAPRVSGWDELVELTCDATTNLCTGELAGPVHGSVRLWALTARTSDSVVLNVAFRGVDERGSWWDAVQAGALHTGDLTQFGLTITPEDLDPGTTRRAETPAGRTLQRVYVSDHPLGEGVSADGVPGPTSASGPQGDFGGQAFTMLGRYQPYGFFLPPGAGPHGVQVAMHGLSENHSARVTTMSGGWTSNGFTDTFGLGEGRIIVSPLGRGWRGWYSGHSERDVLDALGDAMANYPADPDRVLVSGLSMGGFGTLWLGAMHPHLWAGALNWVGWTGDLTNGYPFADRYDSAQWGSRVGAIANALDLVGNLRHVPSAHVYGAADELVHVTQALALRDALAEHLVPSAHWLHPTGEHLSSVLADHWAKEAAYSSGRQRVRDPRTVTFRTDERFFFPELGIVPDHAYWVRNIRPPGLASPTWTPRARGAGRSTPPTASRPASVPSTRRRCWRRCPSTSTRPARRAACPPRS